MYKINNKKNTLIENYYSNNADIYDNSTNKNFLYGEATKKFIKKIIINKKDKVIADIGCGTGYVFEIITKKYEDKKLKFYGIDPAKGMLAIANNKIKDKRVKFLKGSFENTFLSDNSVDKIISTFALHWVSSIDKALKELKRILNNNGSLNILMIEKSDGKEFKKIVFKVMKKYLNKMQIFRAANLVNRITKKELVKKFSEYFDIKKTYNIDIKIEKKLIFGDSDDHIKWWKARSIQIISEVKNKKEFIQSLKEELNKFNTNKGIPFDLSLLEINLSKK